MLISAISQWASFDGVKLLVPILPQATAVIQDTKRCIALTQEEAPLRLPESHSIQGTEAICLAGLT